ncbi:hypothetical protein OH76DRAFT_1205196 [Lentinus brumalis]|uniref:HAT C-terminal dimerisation domain-containing protein n=1 Tax=Lentinus brumalis TaxID=2498619 RepID=A0A371CSU2_9APHY|nr:hypothetical protein OH76DRAFT_1205196 [Polyporus brumalis]
MRPNLVSHTLLAHVTLFRFASCLKAHARTLAYSSEWRTQEEPSSATRWLHELRRLAFPSIPDASEAMRRLSRTNQKAQ